MAAKVQPLVSIVVPVYNADRFIEDTITSVQAQTYENWELILVDDRSIDSSVEKIDKFISNDNRIRKVQNLYNLGVAKTRNAGVAKARGRFLAYLDADDLWTPEKLAEQVRFMTDKKSVFSFTGYGFVDIEGMPTGIYASAPSIVSFKGYLKNNVIWTTTVLVDLGTVSKDDLRMVDLSYGEDALTWLNLLDKYGPAQGIDRQLAYYRRGGSTLSSNKLKAIVNKFRLYQNINTLNSIQGMYYFAHSTVSAIRKRMP